MKLKTGTPLKALNGDVLKEGGQELTIGRAMAGALAAGLKDQKMSPTQVADYYCLAMKLYNQKEVELTSEQVTTCKQAVAGAYTPLVSGQIVEILEPRK